MSRTFRKNTFNPNKIYRQTSAQKPDDIDGFIIMPRTKKLLKKLKRQELKKQSSFSLGE